MSMADHYQTFLDAVAARDNSARWDALVVARHYLKHCDNDDWTWLETSLDDDDRKWFVAAIFSRESLPKRLLPAMVRAAVYERNVSNNRAFIDPCLATYGLDRIRPLVDEYVNSIVPGESSGAQNLLYCCREPRESRGAW